MARLPQWGGSHAEENALSFAEDLAGDDTLKYSHTKKRNKRQKGLEITFDPVAHKEYVTGFHKRKLQRKKDAQRQLEEKAKKARLEERAQKRAELRARLDLDRYMTDSEGEGKEEAEQQQDKKKDVRAFTSNGVSTTVTVAPFSLNSDSDSEPDAPSHKAEDPARSAGIASGNIGEPPSQGGLKKPKQQPKGTFSKYAQPLQGKSKAAPSLSKAQKGGSKKGSDSGKELQTYLLHGF